nr:unnamed protein product [Spirometra erinaceieuropaei]
MPEESKAKLEHEVKAPKKKGCLPNILYHKLVFVASLFFLLFGVVTAIVRPALLFFVFTILFIMVMVNRGFKYARSKDILFLTGICYFVNFYTFIYIWGFPSVDHLLEVQFALANGPVFMGVFLYRNTFAFHNLDKMTTCLIHILPPLISYCIRWFPELSSIWWWTSFQNTNAGPYVSIFYPMGNWIYLYAIPNAAFIIHTVIYHVLVHVIFKPSAKYQDSYRYLCTKMAIVQKPKNKLPPKSHLIVWMLFNIASAAVFMLVACFAWCSFFVHTVMLLVVFFDMTWNAACYYIDYFATLALRKAIAEGTIPDPKAKTGDGDHAEAGKTANDDAGDDDDESEDELDGDEVEIGDQGSVEYDIEESGDEY